MSIPLVNLKKQYLELKPEIDAAVSEVFSNCNFVLGSQVEEFEKSFAKYCGSKYCIGLGSGWDALHLSLRTLDIGPGDEVITTPNTFVATVFPIIEVGAKPVFIDINSLTHQMDIKALARAITKKTAAIIPVHLFGIPNRMDEILKIAKSKKIKIIEDACQAHGSTYKNRHAGTFGDLGAFSFYPGKNLGAAGEAGVVVTNSKTLAQKLRILRDVGQIKKYKHSIVGYNSRMDTIQAAVLSVKLKKLEEWNGQRRQIAKLYQKLLSDLPFTLLPNLGSDYKLNYHLFVIKTKRRDQLLEFLKRNEIYCGIHYPIPVHMQKALKFLGYKKGDFPITEKYAITMLSLPIYAGLQDSEVHKISDLIHQFFASAQRFK